MIKVINKENTTSAIFSAKEFMKTRGWEFKEQIGSGLVFQKDKETTTIETRQY